jgi:hypothetical protein
MDAVSLDEKSKMKEKEIIQRKRLRDGISLDEKSKTMEKEIIQRKRLRDGISLDEKSKTKEKEKNRRKRLRLAKNDTPSISPRDCMKEAKNICTGLKILKIFTNINPLYVSFAINLLLE